MRGTPNVPLEHAATGSVISSCDACAACRDKTSSFSCLLISKSLELRVKYLQQIQERRII